MPEPRNTLHHEVRAAGESKALFRALVALQIFVAIADLWAPPSVVLLTFYLIPVVLAAAFAKPGQVAVLGAMAIILGAGSGFHAGHGHYDSAEYPTSLAALVFVSIAAVVIAHLRTKAEKSRSEVARLLALEQKLLATVLDHTDAHIYMKTREGRFLYANQPSRELIGYPLNEITGKTNADLFPPEVARRLTEHDEKVFLSEEPVVAEETVPASAGGEERIFLSKKIPLRLPGEQERLIGFSTDITVLKRAEAEHRELIELRRRELVELTDSIPVGTYVVSPDEDGVPKFDFVSKRLLHMLQLTEKDVEKDAMAAYRLVHPDDYDEMWRLNAEAFSTGKDFYWEGRLVIGGQTRWMRLESVPRDLPGGRRGWNGVMTDITAHKEAEAKLARREKQLEQVNTKLLVAQEHLITDKIRLRATLDSLLDPHVMMQPVRDGNGLITDFVITQANPAACSYQGTTRDKLVGKRLLELFPSQGPSARLEMYRGLMETGQPLMLNDFVYPGEANGADHRLDIRAVRVDGSISYTWRDVTDRYRAAKEMERRARYDQLTNLLNRTEALDRIEAANSRRTGRKMAVLFCDVDNFKSINDTHGHHAGDEVLRQIAARMKKCLRGDDDLAARLGGDELLVVLWGVHDLDDALAVAEKLRRSVAEPVTIPGGSVHATVSIGVTLATPGESVDSMVARADTALYDAKQTGRNQVISITPPRPVSEARAA